MAGPFKPNRGEESIEGAEPLEEVGPELAQSKPGDLVIKPHELSADGGPERAQISLRTELDEQFACEPIPMVPSPQDGMPIPRDEGSRLALAHPFTVDHCVCVEDDREFVEVFQEEVADFKSRHGRIPDELASRLTLHSRFDANGGPRERGAFAPEVVQVCWGQCVVTGSQAKNWTLVRPKRERCVHYKRQVFANDEIPDATEFGHRIVYRNCAARRTVGGALMSVSGEAVYACDYREPADSRSTEQYLDRPDAEHLRSEAHLKRLPLFGLTGEPETFVPTSATKSATLVSEPLAEGVAHDAIDSDRE